MGKSRTISNLPNVTTNTLTEKLALADADLIRVSDSAASFTEKKTTWSNIKLLLKTITDGLYVALLGDQTIAGIKTFSSSPIVPTPTTALQAATKAFAEGTHTFNATDGYQIFPSGLILQWGYYNTTASTGTITFPIAFPNACFSVTPTLSIPAGTQSYAVCTTAYTVTDFSYAVTSTDRDILWMAIGN